MEIHESLVLLDYIVIAAYIVAVLALGFWVSFRKQHTDDLFLGGRSQSWPTIGLSIFGTNIAPTFMISSCGVAYSSGMVAANFEWLAWPFLMLLAMVFIPHYLNTQISTMPEFINKRFGPTCRSFLSVYMLISTLIVWLGVALFAGGVLLSQILNWPLWVSVLFLIVIAGSFTITGGLAAVMVTDAFQSILMIGASAALTLIAFFKIGSVQRVIDSVPSNYWTLFRPVSDPDFPWPAMIFGYAVMGVWFWCTDQTIVQRVLGGKNMRHAQLGAVFAGFLKIIPPLIFFMPGIFCYVLYPDLKDSNEAYMTMVSNLMPAGMVGLVVAVLIAALISTVDSGLNSFSTIFTIDIYKQWFRPNAALKETKRVGQIVTLVASALSWGIACLIGQIKGEGMFEIFQSILSYLAPALAAVFLVGVMWKRATPTAAMVTLIAGIGINMPVGFCHLKGIPAEFKIHFLYLTIIMFAAMCLIMIVVSLLTPPPDPKYRLPSIRQASSSLQARRDMLVWASWLILAIVMAAIYIIFNCVL